VVKNLLMFKIANLTELEFKEYNIRSNVSIETGILIS
jgi:hypothetical protein